MQKSQPVPSPSKQKLNSEDAAERLATEVRVVALQPYVTIVCYPHLDDALRSLSISKFGGREVGRSHIKGEKKRIGED